MTEEATPVVTQSIRYDNPYFDDREFLDAECTVENPHYDPEKYRRVENPVYCVTVYAVTRHCYGPEEGGNWGNRNDVVISIPMINPGSQQEIDEITAFLKPRFLDEGNIYSVLGGVEYSITAEAEAGYSQTPPYRGYE